MRQGFARSGEDGSQHSDDAALFQRICEKDEKAFAALYDRFAGIVYGVALRVLKDSAAAEDILQDVFLQIWRNPEAFNRSRGAVAPWLAVIARNRSLDRLRKINFETELGETFELQDDSFCNEIENTMLIRKVEDAVREIPAEQRTALEMAFFEGMTQSEIAEKTGTPLGTVKGRIRAAVNAVIGALRP